MTTQKIKAQLAEARQALKLAEKRGNASDIKARRKVITDLEKRLAAAVLAEKAPAQVVKIHEVYSANAQVEAVRITEADTHTPSPEAVERAYKAVDLVNKKHLGE